MVIGTERPVASHNRSWKDCIAIGLDEATTALEESFHDLTDEQIWFRPVPERHCIGTMVMHCLENLATHACRYQTGRTVTMADHALFDMWSCAPDALDERQRQEDQPLPSAGRMVQWLGDIRREAVAGLDAATEEDLRGPRNAAEWCRQHDRTAGDAYARTTFHIMAHVRQIWCLRGAMGAFGEAAWPLQHYA